MVSGVVAKLNIESEDRAGTVREIAAHRQMEIGELIEGRLLPVTIEASDQREMKKATYWLESCPGVAMVDVVYVQFEEEDDVQGDAPHGHRGDARDDAKQVNSD